MSSVVESPEADVRARWMAWLPVLLGLAALYVPTFVMLARDHWPQDEQAHGPIILAVAVWLIWRKREVLSAGTVPAPRSGFALVALGLLFYIGGRTLGIGSFESGSIVLVLFGAVLCLRGWPAASALWFPILFLIFYVPLPGVLVDAITGPLKERISEIAEVLLFELGYPVARSGVMLTIGQYQLLVADACAGMQSMFSLTALGLLYLHISGARTALHTALMIAAILPIAFFANLVRVLTLMLVTYYLGDEAGQGLVHGSTGIFLFIVGLLSLMALDGLLALALRTRRAAPAT